MRGSENRSTGRTYIGFMKELLYHPEYRRVKELAFPSSGNDVVVEGYL
jgi:hypothetical protein